ncbi:MAG: PIN domain-containing protein, partial [Gemmatimonadaceae bacterium]
DPAPPPIAALKAWIASVPGDELGISVLTLAELRYGIELLPAGGKKQSDLMTWLTSALPLQFVGHIFPVDERVAAAWGPLAAAGHKAGRQIPVADGYLLATAQVHGLTLVTRNQRDCANRGVSTINPYGIE